MSLQENIKNIIFYYVKKKYNECLEEKKQRFINDEELNQLVDNLYTIEKESLQKYIRSCLKDIYLEDYNSALVENIIYEIFDDEELAKNRVILEIKSYQNHQDKKNSFYKVSLIPDTKYGIGLKLEFEPYDILISSFKKNPENNQSLPAEESLISIGDSIVSINGFSLISKTTDEAVKIITDNINTEIVYLELKTYSDKSQMEIVSLLN